MAMLGYNRTLINSFARNSETFRVVRLGHRQLKIRPVASRHFAASVAIGESSNASQTDAPNTRESWLFVDSVFPVRLSRWDFRHYIGIFREEILLERLSSLLSFVKTHNFEVVSLETHQKDGGVFVRFKYSAVDSVSALDAIQKSAREAASKHGGIPSWIELSKGNVWLVRGTPWREDMNRFASPIIKLAFEGPDVHEESLYEVLRPYGQIRDLTSPTPVPTGSLRFSTITFQHIRAATIARNVLHGFNFSEHSSSSKAGSGSGPSSTRFRMAYEQPIKPHVIRDWMSDHPKTVLPVIVFFLGTLTYTIFDPIRQLMVEAKMLDWFDVQEFKLYKWLRANTFDRLLLTGSSDEDTSVENVWKERKDAEVALRSYLSDLPTTVAFIHGPQGSGKTRMLKAVLHETRRKVLIIDCAELHKATSDSALLSGLARQTGYWPVFTFLNSMNSLIDLASVGLIGQKAGLSSSLTQQLQQMLEVVGTALVGVSSSHRNAIQRKIKRQELEEEKRAEEASRSERIRRGIYHDGRLDCVAGNGVMSELGFGDELMTSDDMEGKHEDAGEGLGGKTEGWEEIVKKEELEERERKQDMEDPQAVGALPIVVIRNFASKGGANRGELLTVLASWAATLTDNQVAHVIVISDNRENSKQLAKALPSKPLSSIALYDADAASALSFVKQKLKDAGVDQTFTAEQTAYLERLGGRASDLESLIRKIRSGQRVQEAVEDIISRGVGELRKNAFGDDIEDAKTLAWSSEQAWIVLKKLSKQEEIPYHDLLIDFPFKGDETPLRNMEHAELISINTYNGRPSSIRPGKPVYKYVFEQLVGDPIFQATQDIAFNEKVIASSESKIRVCEDELMRLKEIGADSSWWGSKRASSERAAYLYSNMLAAERKIEVLEKRNAEFKKILSKGG
ncbi:hypothetical protein PILCRDRAFT_815213 [Piloderma croceum F 1598]|uniref:Mitochondrial escape protein 2 n=1 Tax=Piloderma croceum (strain F 1598) TaxID=765440 RepID=A0A0C3GAJ0_PILCF|nr:hypothetical protein PILCRDRAFT_815213 [Piloderma croceum F 1598]